MTACICSAENNYLVMLGHMSKQIQLWLDAEIIWSDVILSSQHHCVRVLIRLSVVFDVARAN